MWLENTINELIQFVKAFLSTFLFSIIKPWRTLNSLKNNPKSDSLKPTIYFFISLILFIVFFSTRTNSITFIENTWFIDQTNQIVKATTKSLPVTFDLTTFLYAFPIFFIYYLIIAALILIFRIADFEKKVFFDYIYLWSGSALLFFIAINIIASILWEHAPFFLGKSASKAAVYSFYFILKKSLLLVLPYIAVSIPCGYAILKNYRKTQNWKLFLIPLLVALSIDIIFYSNVFLNKYFNESIRNPIALKGGFSNHFIQRYMKYDSACTCKITKFDIIFYNESDTIFVLPKESTMNLYNYSKDEIEKWDAETAQNKEDIIMDIKTEKRRFYSFNISRIENSTDSILVLKPGDIKRITFSAKLSSEDYHDLFEVYASTLKLGEIDIYKPPNNTTNWEQFWIKREIYQLLTFDIFIAK
jgi:hypothetical protein